jgi:hypothetical protein
MIGSYATAAGERGEQTASCRARERPSWFPLTASMWSWLRSAKPLTARTEPVRIRQVSLDGERLLIES